MGAALGRYLAAVGAALTQCVTAGAEELTSSRDDEDAPTSSEVTEGGLATLAGDGSCGWKLTGNPRTTSVYAPFGVAADAVHVYAALHDSDRIIRIPRGGGPPEVVAGGGDSETDGALAQRARIQNPRGLALSRGHLYFCTGHKVRCLAPGGRVSTVAGTGAAGHGGDGGPAGEALLNTPVGVAVHEGTLYIACYKEGRVRGVDLKTNTIVTVAGTGARGHSGDGGPAASADLDCPHDVCVSGGGLLIADYCTHRVRRVDLSTGRITTWAGGGERPVDGPTPAASARLHSPRGLAAGEGGRIYITDEHRVLMLHDGTLTAICGGTRWGFGGDGGPAADGQLCLPFHVAWAGSTLYVADNNNHRVRKILLPEGITKVDCSSAPPLADSRMS
eukprot:TRINITY_DN1032_c0_g1_i3.p2 TRINITY_DN1032_c0_g1~~TRINITY_DN1032_c0_g1_i3.p2  ORF type:complete len:414 (+),score=121.21 TRINITY_DN1032_c0_g1_i3:74-1243(+)